MPLLPPSEDYNSKNKTSELPEDQATFFLLWSSSCTISPLHTCPSCICVSMPVAANKGGSRAWNMSLLSPYTSQPTLNGSTHPGLLLNPVNLIIKGCHWTSQGIRSQWNTPTEHPNGSCAVVYHNVSKSASWLHVKALWCVYRNLIWLNIGLHWWHFTKIFPGEPKLNFLYGHKEILNCKNILVAKH